MAKNIRIIPNSGSIYFIGDTGTESNSIQVAINNSSNNVKIYDGQYSENVTVADTYVFGSTTVPLTSPLLYDHDPSVSISALPPAIKEAAILVTTAFLKVRGDSSMTMGIANSASLSQNLGGNLGEEIALAKQLVNPYKRVR